jgi:hypothetical protein
MSSNTILSRARLPAGRQVYQFRHFGIMKLISGILSQFLTLNISLLFSLLPL